MSSINRGKFPTMYNKYCQTDIKPKKINSSLLGEVSDHLKVTALLPDSFWEILSLDKDAKNIRFLVSEFEKKMHYILRWQSNMDSVNQIESDLQHVGSMLQMVNKIEELLPHLSGQLNLDYIRMVILLHDIGEAREGDLPATMLTKPEEKKERDAHKDSEYKEGLTMIHSFSRVDKDVSKKGELAFNAYEFRNSSLDELSKSKFSNVSGNAQSIFTEISLHKKELYFVKMLDILQAFFWGDNNLFMNTQDSRNESGKALKPLFFKKAFDLLWDNFSKSGNRHAQHELLDLIEIFLSNISNYHSTSDIEANIMMKRDSLRQESPFDNPKTIFYSEKKSPDKLGDLIQIFRFNFDKIFQRSIEDGVIDNSEYSFMHSYLNEGNRFVASELSQRILNEQASNSYSLESLLGEDLVILRKYILEKKRDILSFKFKKLKKSAVIFEEDEDYSKFLGDLYSEKKGE